MTYARPSDEGYRQLEGDLGDEAPCPEDCEDYDSCGFCFERCCPTHGVPRTVTGELSPEDTYIGETCEGPAHRACHTSNCRSRYCYEDAA